MVMNRFYLIIRCLQLGQILTSRYMDIQTVFSDCRARSLCYRILSIPIVGRGAMLRGLDPRRQLLLERENPRTLFGKNLAT